MSRNLTHNTAGFRLRKIASCLQQLLQAGCILLLWAGQAAFVQAQDIQTGSASIDIPPGTWVSGGSIGIGEGGKIRNEGGIHLSQGWMNDGGTYALTGSGTVLFSEPGWHIGGSSSTTFHDLAVMGEGETRSDVRVTGVLVTDGSISTLNIHTETEAARVSFCASAHLGFRIQDLSSSDCAGPAYRIDGKAFACSSAVLTSPVRKGYDPGESMNRVDGDMNRDDARMETAFMPESGNEDVNQSTWGAAIRCRQHSGACSPSQLCGTPTGVQGLCYTESDANRVPSTFSMHRQAAAGHSSYTGEARFFFFSDSTPA